jgi:uncharacterized lipoprotein YddW (UPF0748 family)
MPPKKENNGCGCASVPFSLIIVLLGAGYWGFVNLDKLGIRKILANIQPSTLPNWIPKPSQHRPISDSPFPQVTPSKKLASNPLVTTMPTLPKKSLSSQTAWEKKEIRGIYLSRYQVTNNASEQVIRQRVTYYRAQGINTIVHGVWGNGCTMYDSKVMQQTFGPKSCPNQFQSQWLDWLIDEAHKQGMEVHAYFEKGIKIDKNSPIFDEAVAKRWIVPGVDKTYAGIEQYVLDMEVPEVSDFFRKISVEFVQKYPTVDAVQWDDYLGYYAGLPGKIDRTKNLTNFVRNMRSDIKKVNSTVSFDLCHHNPYWSKRYFAADWKNWNVDRVFIQTYNDANFNQELDYAEQYAGAAISDGQLYRLKELVSNTKIKSVLVFPLSGKPEETAALVKKLTSTSQ